jgi:hypothetical protein
MDSPWQYSTVQEFACKVNRSIAWETGKIVDNVLKKDSTLPMLYKQAAIRIRGKR